MTNKFPGRVSDSSIIGAGTYADNQTCALSGTGTGDQFIQNVLAFDVHAQILYEKKSLNEAAAHVLEKLKRSKGSGGLIALDTLGNCVLPFNTLGMFRGKLDIMGELDVGIFEKD